MRTFRGNAGFDQGELRLRGLVEQGKGDPGIPELLACMDSLL